MSRLIRNVPIVSYLEMSPRSPQIEMTGAISRFRQKLVNAFTVRSYSVYLAIDGVISNHIRSWRTGMELGSVGEKPMPAQTPRSIVRARLCEDHAFTQNREVRSYFSAMRSASSLKQGRNSCREPGPEGDLRPEWNKPDPMLHTI